MPVNVLHDHITKMMSYVRDSYNISIDELTINNGAKNIWIRGPCRLHDKRKCTIDINIEIIPHEDT